MKVLVTHDDAFPLAHLPPDAHLVGRAQAEVRDMAASLREVQIEAIVIAEFGPGTHPRGCGYDVLGGTCRVKAARLNGMPALRADIWQGLSWDDFVRLRSVANSRRSKNPLADVEALRAMVRLGLSYTEMARLLQKHPAEVKELLKFLGLPDEILRAYGENRVAQSVLRQVAKLGPERRRAAVQVLQAKTRLTGADIGEINRAGRSQARAQLAVTVPALQLPRRPTLPELIARLVQEQHIDLNGNGHPPAGQSLWLSSDDLAALRRLLPNPMPHTP
jgi:ParB-like chromosome segregation protein Spo0J